ncbi:hypothetical protein K438DRAFT_1785184 [Mycena galopus ATCC 62051]|nr:hypothetical protein K438DRAFT_1785184 [Mycena galopus ATCC 62051]
MTQNGLIRTLGLVACKTLDFCAVCCAQAKLQINMLDLIREKLYTNRPLNKKLKPELQAIASAMGQDPKQSVLLLHECIQKYMTVYPEAADDPKFLPLFAHRSAPKGVVKNSADKVAEEVAASSEAAPKATTGAVVHHWWVDSNGARDVRGFIGHH